jgi:D-sedoheptulose 7-phosphate isomerase
MENWIDTSLAEAVRLAGWLTEHERVVHTIQQMGDRLAVCLTNGGRILTCGNGGSMCDAMHMAEELSGRFRHDRQALAAQAISDPAHLTCVANDFGYQQVFARGVEAWGRPGDVLVAFSTSGNSPNVVLAAEAARGRGMSVLGLLGRDGGTLANGCDISLVVPAQDSGRIQEMHIKVVHLLIEFVERRLFPDNYPGNRASSVH